MVENTEGLTSVGILFTNFLSIEQTACMSNYVAVSIKALFALIEAHLGFVGVLELQLRCYQEHQIVLTEICEMKLMHHQLSI